MKRFSIPLGLALAVLSLLAAGTPVQAGERPFNASGEGFVSTDPGGNGLLISRCEATHLGRSFLEVGLSEANNLNVGRFAPIGGSLTSASGDVLYFDFDYLFYRFDPVIGVVSETLTFTGGTGRFQDATGHADVMFVFDSNLQQFLFLIDGSIDY